MEKIETLLDWMDQSTCNFMAVDTIRHELEEIGFQALDQKNPWELEPNGRYYVIKNGTAIFAFIIGNVPASEAGFHIISAHSDSPCFKLKPNCEIYGDGGVVSLNVEKYGGGILYTWFDRPLSISGRVLLRSGNPLRPESRLVDFDRPIATIPHLAIHFNRGVNDGNPLSVQKDMKPVLGYLSPEEIAEAKEAGGPIRCMLAQSISL